MDRQCILLHPSYLNCEYLSTEQQYQKGITKTKSEKSFQEGGVSDGSVTPVSTFKAILVLATFIATVAFNMVFLAVLNRSGH